MPHHPLSRYRWLLWLGIIIPPVIALIWPAIEIVVAFWPLLMILLGVSVVVWLWRTPRFQSLWKDVPVFKKILMAGLMTTIYAGIYFALKEVGPRIVAELTGLDPENINEAYWIQILLVSIGLVMIVPTLWVFYRAVDIPGDYATMQAAFKVIASAILMLMMIRGFKQDIAPFKSVEEWFEKARQETAQAAEARTQTSAAPGRTTTRRETREAPGRQIVLAAAEIQRINAPRNSLAPRDSLKLGQCFPEIRVPHNYGVYVTFKGGDMTVYTGNWGRQRVGPGEGGGVHNMMGAEDRPAFPIDKCDMRNVCVWLHLTTGEDRYLTDFPKGQNHVWIENHMNPDGILCMSPQYWAKYRDAQTHETKTDGEMWLSKHLAFGAIVRPVPL